MQIPYWFSIDFFSFEIVAKSFTYLFLKNTLVLSHVYISTYDVKYQCKDEVYEVGNIPMYNLFILHNEILMYLWASEWWNFIYISWISVNNDLWSSLMLKRFIKTINVWYWQQIRITVAVLCLLNYIKKNASYSTT